MDNKAHTKRKGAMQGKRKSFVKGKFDCLTARGILITQHSHIVSVLSRFDDTPSFNAYLIVHSHSHSRLRTQVGSENSHLYIAYFMLRGSNQFRAVVGRYAQATQNERRQRERERQCYTGVLRSYELACCAALLGLDLRNVELPKWVNESESQDRAICLCDMLEVEDLS